jgi:uncharacterized protein YukE
MAILAARARQSSGFPKREGKCSSDKRLTRFVRPDYTRFQPLLLSHRDATMSQAIVDPAELRRFAQSLKRFNSELQNGLAVLHGQMVSLGDTWRDQEHLKFVQEFEQTTQMLDRFIESMNQHVPYLQRKAERIEDYLQQK